MMDFRAALIAAGLRPRDVVPDGRWKRCATDDKPRKRNGAYKLGLNGRHGWYRNWATHDTVQSWSDDTEYRTTPIDDARQRAARERERRARIQAMRSARAYWYNSLPLNRPHPYLERKGLSPLGCAGLRCNDGLLVVPVWHGEWLISVQTIHPDGTKRFAYGAPVKAGCWVIDRPRAAVTAIVEGVATGLAVYQSVRQARVIVAFNAGNLLPVARRVRPTGSVVFVADNDHGTAVKRGFNPGIDKARNAAELIGAGMMWFDGIEGTDAADALKEWGQGAPKRIERMVLAGAKYIAGDVVT